MVPEHLGGLHAYEQALTLLVAFGPFVVLGIVVAVRRRRDLEEEERGEDDARPGPDPRPTEGGDHPGGR
jgi:hypothetical protein